MVDRITLTQDDIADDWPKIRTWGFPDVNTYDEFIGMVGDTEDAVGLFVQLPAWNPAPQPIKDGVAAAYPNLVPMFFSMPEVLTKHLTGKHDQLAHGAWAGVNRDTPEYQAKMARVEQMRADGKVLPEIDGTVWSLMSEYGDSEYYFEEQKFIEDYMQDEWDEAMTQATADVMGDDWVMITDEQRRDIEARAIATMRVGHEDAWGVYQAMLEDAGYDPDNYQFMKAFGHTSDDGRFMSEVEDTEYSVDEQMITVRGSIYIDGDVAGDFERNIYYDDATYGGTHVHRNLFRLNEEYRGEGVAAWFNGAMQDVYLASGVDAVSIYAVDLSYGDPDTPGGPAVWASQGYDWDLAQGYSAYDAVRSSVENYIVNNPEYFRLPAAVKSNINDVMRRMDDLSPNDVEFPTPREIWMLGRVGDIKGKTGWWPGKSILGHSGASQSGASTGEANGPSAYYVLRLSEGMRVTEAQIEAANVRDRIARNIVEARSGATQKTLPMDEQFITVNGQPIPLFPDESRGISGSNWIIEEMEDMVNEP